ncbi:MAG TPA: hypothetical protein VFF63_03655 [Candidatus Babeliales bacterium]|nr:hypothetical protein [Candidatus Babeliales bacterium]
MTVYAMLFALAQPATHLTVQPWTGADLQTTTQAAAKYRLEISGAPNATVHLRADGVAPGWLAAFCTPHICSPQRIDFTLSPSGDDVIQFELIREADDAPKQSDATIVSEDGASVAVPTAYRQ